MKTTTKKETLKKLQEELLALVKEKYYKDEEIKECVDKINSKYEEMKIKAEERKKKKLNAGEIVKEAFVKISLKTAIFCNKLIVKERVSNQIMGYDAPNELQIAEKEINEGVALWNESNN